MSSQWIFARYKANEIRADLQSFEVKKFKLATLKRKNALRKIIANLTLGNYNEMVHLLPEILKFWQIEDDLEVKRICHEYVRILGAWKPRNFNECLPLIILDLKSNKESIQTMALNTLVLVPNPDFSNEAFKFIHSLLNAKTTSPEVLKCAINLLPQLDEIDHSQTKQLLRVLRDIVEMDFTAVTVQVAALYVLYSIQETSQDMEPLNIEYLTALRLLKHLPQLNEWDRVLLLEAFPISVVPQTYSDAHDAIRLIEPQLQHVNTSVALNALKCLLYLLNYVDEVEDFVIRKVASSLVALLNNQPELQFLVLRNIILLLLSREDTILDLDISHFFVEYNDPIYIKDTKLECLYLLANETTLDQILEELEQYATDIDIQMSRKSIRAIGNLAVKLDETCVENCASALLDLLDFGVDYVVQEIISVFRNILRKYPDRLQYCVQDLIKHTDSIKESEPKNAMIWIITQYSHSIPNCLELFKRFSDSFLEETLDVQLSILTSSVKIFMKDSSPATEQLCMQVLNLSLGDVDNPDLKSRAHMYWNLLSLPQRSPNITRDMIASIVDGELPVIELNTKLDPALLQELELNLGSVASIYLKPVAQIFRLNKTRHLPDSPVLNQSGTLSIVDSSRYTPFSRRSTATSGTFNASSTDSVSTNRKTPTMEDFDKPAQKVNHLKGRMKSSSQGSSKLSRKPSMLMRKLSMKKPF